MDEGGPPSRRRNQFCLWKLHGRSKTRVGFDPGHDGNIMGAANGSEKARNSLYEGLVASRLDGILGYEVHEPHAGPQGRRARPHHEPIGERGKMC